MGRPLYSTLLARRATDRIPTQPSPSPVTPAAETEHPVIEKWSRWNSFDPDSEEFLQGQDAVYEAFLTEEEIIAREEAQRFERARRITDALVRQEISNEDQRLGGSDFWADGNVNVVVNPRPATYAFDGPEVSAEDSSPRLPQNSIDGSPSTVLGNQTLETPQSIPVIPSPRNNFPVPNTPARISGFFSPRRMSVGFGATPISRHVDIRIVPAPEPLIS